MNYDYKEDFLKDLMIYIWWWWWNTQISVVIIIYKWLLSCVLVYSFSKYLSRCQGYSSEQGYRQILSLFQQRSHCLRGS